ncbi:MAG: rhodanese-like domain-containing protein [Desulfobacteraceae bacterium]|nr:rhodanese-like domain-containing protein [Desulfobacteraceae bacterium]
MPIKPNNTWIKVTWQMPAIILIAGLTGLFVNYFRADTMPFKADWSIKAHEITADGKRLDISLVEAEKLFTEKRAVFFDARSWEDYENGHISGARSLPWHEVEQRFVEATKNISSDTTIITYCDGETCNLSHDLAIFLKDMGFSNVRVLVNGWTVWQES